MCGFVAHISLEENNFNKSRFIDSAKYISHRGPDSRKTFFHKDINLIFYRLRVRDLSPNGDQPMLSYTKKNIIVFNGEIYNAEELKKKLDKVNFRGQSDTEVLINLYEKYGLSILDQLEGMFSFLIYNFEKKEVVAVRDRFGIKPLYYFKNEKYIFFSSEIKPIIKYINKIKFNDLAFANFFFKQELDNGDQTFFESIKSVPPANIITLKKDKKIKFIVYWSILKKSFEYHDTEKKFEELFDQSINKHLIADCDIGLLFSGGTDSTALALSIAKKKQTALKTFTYDFSNNFTGGESVKAQIISKKLNIQNFLSIVNPKYIIKNFDKMCFDLESPFTSIRLFGVRKVYENINKHKIKVAIEGGGGDEILGGYEYNFLNFLMDKIKSNKKNLNIIFDYLVKTPSEEKILNKLITLSFQAGSTKDCTPFIDLDNFNKDFINTYLKENFYLSGKYYKDINFLQKSQLLDINKINLPRSLKYMDRLAMISSVENRVPFLDHKLAGFSFHLKNEFKIKKDETRFILKKLYKKQKYSHFFTKSKKTIVDPQRDWLRKELKSFVYDEINSRAFKECSYFNSKNFLTNYSNFILDKKKTSFNLFQIFTAFKFIENFRKF